jgi:hypothetical protein
MTLTAKASDEPLHTIIHRLQHWFARLRRTTTWKTAIRGAVAGIEVTYGLGRGWHVHIHLLASRQAWVDQADLAAAWQHVTGGQGTIVDIRDRDADVRAKICRTLTYPFKPTNLAAWGPAQVAEFTALGRTKLAECYGALRGLAATAADDADPPTSETPARVLAPGMACPRCHRPLTTQWVTRQILQHARQPEDRRTQAPPGSPQAA